jgi:uncharacterized protein YraI
MTLSARLTPWLGAFLFVVSIAASAQEAFTTRTVNVRAGPDTSYPTVAVLGPGTPVQVMGCLDDWSWCDVDFADNRGWVYSPFLSYVYEGYRVPFYSYAPSFGIPIITFSLGSYWDRYYRGRPWYGRRDYWASRAPVHVRPAGPSPRSTPPPLRAYPQARPGESRAYERDRTRQGNPPPASRAGGAPSIEGRRPYAGAQSGPPPSENRGAERRAPGAPSRAGNAPQAGGERTRSGGEQRAAPPAPRGGNEPRAERPAARDGGERRGQEGRGSEEKPR